MAKKNFSEGPFAIFDTDRASYVDLEVRGWDEILIRYSESHARVYTGEDVNQAFGNFVCNVESWDVREVK